MLDGSRAVLARAITLVESQRADHRAAAQQLLLELLPHAGGAARVGISGPPGVGKSTFIEALGTRLTAAGHRVAVLAVDPSSTRTGGSILGDKTRMARLAVDQNAFVRPSPSAGTLGGVARATRETIVLMEAAGYDVVLVETVGVGQSEVTVAGMVDSFLLLTLRAPATRCRASRRASWSWPTWSRSTRPTAARERDARAAARELSGALHLMAPGAASWRPPVLACSGRTGDGLAEVWAAVAAAPRRPWRRPASWPQAGRAAGGLDVGDGPRPAAGPAAHRPRGAGPAARAGARRARRGTSPRRWPPRPCSTCCGPMGPRGPAEYRLMLTPRR